MDFVDSEIQKYAERHTSTESGVLENLRQLTMDGRSDKSMLSGFYQGRLLAMFSKMLQPHRILEIGTYVGYSAMCLAEGLSEDGKVITLDVNEETTAVAKEFWGRAGFEDKIEARLGSALEIIPELDETLDLVFIDADKTNYSNYYDLVFPKLRLGAVVIADNVLWGGKVMDVEDGWTVNESTKALHEFNHKIQQDARVSNILFVVRDGLMIIRKEKD